MVVEVCSLLLTPQLHAQGQHDFTSGLPSMPHYAAMTWITHGPGMATLTACRCTRHASVCQHR